jgi:hypothetical protein
MSLWRESLEKSKVICFRVIDILHFSPSLNLLGIKMNIAVCPKLMLSGFETSLKNTRWVSSKMRAVLKTLYNVFVKNLISTREYDCRFEQHNLKERLGSKCKDMQINEM